MLFFRGKMLALFLLLLTGLLTYYFNISAQSAVALTAYEDWRIISITLMSRVFIFVQLVDK